jgi:hypothetical protein
MRSNSRLLTDALQTSLRAAPRGKTWTLGLKEGEM